MGDKVRVDVAVPVYGPQFPEWWFPHMRNLLAWNRLGIDVTPMSMTGAMPDVSKSTGATAFMLGNNTGITSVQRNNAVIRQKAEWLFFIDHDTVPPEDALPRLLEHRKPFVAGVYYHRLPPYAPLMYKRTANGLYQVVRDYEKGAVMEVDAVGMGCTLIHRNVFEAIYNQFIHFMRANGTNFIIHKDDVVGKGLPREFRVNKPMVFQGPHGWHTVSPLDPMQKLREEETTFPFYSMEEGRTEDIVFCEHAERVGYKPIIDTSIECKHFHAMPVTGEAFQNARKVYKQAGVMSPVIEEVGDASA